jgi:hypothetical protein
MIHDQREVKLDKICTISTLLAVILAIVAAFVSIPMAAAILLVLGGIGALNTSGNPDLRLRIYAAAIVLTLGAGALAQIPVVGVSLADIFSGVGMAFVGASVVAVTLAIIRSIQVNLLK